MIGFLVSSFDRIAIGSRQTYFLFLLIPLVVHPSDIYLLNAIMFQTPFSFLPFLPPSLPLSFSSFFLSFFQQDLIP